MVQTQWTCESIGIILVFDIMIQLLIVQSSELVGVFGIMVIGNGTIQYYCDNINILVRYGTVYCR